MTAPEALDRLARYVDRAAHPDDRAMLTRDVDAVRHALDFTWDDLLTLLDQHYPEEVFPAVDDRPDRDPGPRILSLARRLHAAEAQLTHVHELTRGTRERFRGMPAYYLADQIQAALGDEGGTT